MRRVAVAIKTTGLDPKEHRIAELAAVEVKGGTAGESLHLQITTDGASGASQGIAFQAALATWTSFITGSTIIVHDYYELKRFLRAECAREGARFTIAKSHPVVDTWQLAKDRFPKQRHSLEAVTRKLGIKANLAASDALETARIVARAAGKLLETQEAGAAPVTAIGEAPESRIETPAAAEQPTVAPVSPCQRSLRERLTLCWQVLVGHA